MISGSPISAIRPAGSQIRALSPERFEFYVGHAPDETVDEALGILTQMI